MDPEYLDLVSRTLLARGWRLEPGLTDAEVAATEARFEIEFPPDLRQLLQTILPVGLPESLQVIPWARRLPSARGGVPVASRLKTWWRSRRPPRDANKLPNWRDASKENVEHLRSFVRLPIELVVFQVSNGVWWVDDWGDRPDSGVEAGEIALKHALASPRLVPLESRPYIYMPSTGRSGEPIFEYVFEYPEYGAFDLPGYLAKLGVPIPDQARLSPLRVPLWTDVISLNQFQAETVRVARARHDAFVRFFETAANGPTVRELFYRRFDPTRPKLSGPTWWDAVSSVYPEEGL